MTFPQLGSISSKYMKYAIFGLVVVGLVIGISYLTRSKRCWSAQWASSPS
jgi:hypothetical protein